MAKTPDQPHDRPEWRRSEARLKEFMRRASPIVVAERGWNERSQAKIQMLASDLELPAHLYEIALERLQQGELHFDDQLTSAEQQYVNYLRTHFGRSKIRVLTGTHEKRAVIIARREYEIPKSRARQLVRQVAAELGISRVSRLDAEQHVADLIEETIGQVTNISDRTRGRIFAAGTKWGVESRQVEILINNRLEANRQAVAPGNPWLVRWMAICLSILVMTLLAWFGYVLFTSSSNPDAGTTGDEIENRDAAATDARLTAPFWWNENTRLAFDAFTLNPRTARFPHELLIDSDYGQRRSGYRSVIQLIGESPGVVAEQCIELFACCYADESTPNAIKMAPLIAELDKLSMDRLPPGIRVYQNQWQANELLGRCAGKNIGSQKLEALDNVAIAISGIAPSHTGGEYTERGGFVLAGRQWDHVNTLGFQSPELAARLFEPLSELTRNRLGQAHPAEFSTAISLLSVRPDSWTLLRDPLQRLIREIDEDQVLQLFTLGSRSNVAELQSWLALKLAQRLGIATERSSRQWVESAIQSRLGMAPTSTNIFLPRRERLMELLERNGVFDELLPADPQSIATVAHFATIAMLLEQSERNGNRELLSTVDDLLSRSPRNLAVRTSQTRTRNSLPVYRRVARRALPSDIRSRDEALESLAEGRALNDQARAIAFERLGRVAPRFRDITQEQATMLAVYMLNATTTSELVAIEKSCGQMKHWPNLALALADEIRSSDCPIDQAITCAGLMTGAQFDLGEDKNWRLSLYHVMMDRIAAGMQHTAELAGKDTRYQWNELKRYLTELYRLRCLAVGIDGAAASGARSPAELAELLLPGILDQTDRQSLNRQIRSNHFLADDELHLFALHGQLMAGSPSPEFESDTLPAILLRNETSFLDKLTRAP